MYLKVDRPSETKTDLNVKPVAVDLSDWFFISLCEGGSL